MNGLYFDDLVLEIVVDGALCRCITIEIRVADEHRAARAES